MPMSDAAIGTSLTAKFAAAGRFLQSLQAARTVA